MKGKELRELTKEELLKKRKDIKEELFNLRFQHSSGQLENTARHEAPQEGCGTNRNGCTSEGIKRLKRSIWN